MENALSCQGHWQDGTSTAVAKVSVKRLRDLIVITFDDGRVLSHLLKQAQVTAPMADLPLRLTFADGTMLTVPDSPAARALVSKKFSLLPSFVEGHFLKMSAFLLLGTIFCIWILGQFVVPVISSYIGDRLPLSMANNIGDTYFQEIAANIKLEEGTYRHRRVVYLGDEVLETVNANKQFNYRFMIATDFGSPNAFALPNGHIIVTEEALDAFGHDEDELFAVLAHEVGHVEKRHSLKKLVNATTWYLLASLLFNDYAFILAPVVIGSQLYSREQELEADCFAAQALHSSGRDEQKIIIALKNITGDKKAQDDDPQLQKEIEEMERERRRKAGEPEKEEQGIDSDDDEDTSIGVRLITLLSSHPSNLRREELLAECDLS